MKREVTITCSGKCGKSITADFKDIKKCDYYLCGDEECSAVLFAKIEQKSKKSFASLVNKHTIIDQKAIGDFTGVSFFENVKGKKEFGVYGEQRFRLKNEENIFALITRKEEKPYIMDFDMDELDAELEELFPSSNEPIFTENIENKDEIVGFNIVHEDGSIEYINLIDEDDFLR